MFNQDCTYEMKVRIIKLAQDFFKVHRPPSRFDPTNKRDVLLKLKLNFARRFYADGE